MTIEPISDPLKTVDYATMDDKRAAVHAVGMGRAAFSYGADNRLVDRHSLNVRLRICENDVEEKFREITVDNFGDEGWRFADNTEGKAITAQDFCMDSDEAMREHGLQVVAGGDKNDPRSWRGSVYYIEYVEIDGVEHKLEIVVACSGVQAAFDKAFSYFIASAFGALWVERMKARYALAA